MNPAQNKRSSANHRIYEDLSYSNPAAIGNETENLPMHLQQNSNQHTNQSSFNDGASGSTPNLGQDHHYIGYNISGIPSAANPSIHISFSRAHADELMASRDRQGENLQSNMNPMDPNFRGESSRRSGNR